MNDRLQVEYMFDRDRLHPQIRSCGQTPGVQIPEGPGSASAGRGSRPYSRSPTSRHRHPARTVVLRPGVVTPGQPMLLTTWPGTRDQRAGGHVTGDDDTDRDRGDPRHRSPLIARRGHQCRPRPEHVQVGEPRTQPGRALTVWATQPMTTSTAPYLDDKGPDDTGYRALAPRTGRYEHRPTLGAAPSEAARGCDGSVPGRASDLRTGS